MLLTAGEAIGFGDDTSLMKTARSFAVRAYNNAGAVVEIGRGD